MKITKSPGRILAGIDGGGTGCRAALADATGRILGNGSAGPANIATDIDEAILNIVAAVRSAIAAAEVDVALSDVVAGIGLAGANVPELVEAVAVRLPFIRRRIETDGFVAVKGALRDSDGIVTAIGTGSIFSIQRGGLITQIGGWGFTLGDDGSGAWIGRALLARTLRGIDGFRTMTPLLQRIANDYGGRAGIIAFAAQSRATDFARLASNTIHSTDPAAVEIMELADREIVSAIETLRQGASLPVAFVGGLGRAFASRLESRVSLTEPLGTQLDGALWLARQVA